MQLGVFWFCLVGYSFIKVGVWGRYVRFFKVWDVVLEDVFVDGFKFVQKLQVCSFIFINFRSSLCLQKVFVLYFVGGWVFLGQWLNEVKFFQYLGYGVVVLVVLCFGVVNLGYGECFYLVYDEFK